MSSFRSKRPGSSKAPVSPATGDKAPQSADADSTIRTDAGISAETVISAEKMSQTSAKPRSRLLHSETAPKAETATPDPAAASPAQNYHPAEAAAADDLALTEPAAAFDDRSAEALTEPHVGERLLASISQRAESFLFSYSAKLKSLVSWSPNAVEVLGAPLPSIMRDGNLFLRHVHPDDQFRVLAALEDTLTGARAFQISYRWIRPDRNELRLLHCRASLERPQQLDQPIDSASHEGLAYEPGTLLVGMIIDVTDVLQTTSSDPAPMLDLSQLQAAASLFFTIDRDLRVVSTNRPKGWRAGRAREALQGVSVDQLDFGDPYFVSEGFQPGRPLLEAFGTETLRLQYLRVFEQLLAGTLSFHQTRLSHVEPALSLELYPWRRGNEILGIIGVAHDHSLVAQLERQVADLRRAEGLRSLASGVSHHVNNVLQGIIGQATLIESHADDAEAVAREARSIGELVQRASELVQQLFSFDESAQGALAPVDLNLSVMAAVSAVEDLFVSPLEIQVSFGNPLPVLSRQQALVDVIQELLRIARDHASSQNQDQANLAGSKSAGGAHTEGSPHSARPAESLLVIKTQHTEISAADMSRTRPGIYSQLSIAEVRRGGAPPDRPLRRMRSLHSVTSSAAYRKAQSAVERFGGAVSAQLSPNGEFAILLLFPAVTSADSTLAVIDSDAAPEILVVDDDPMVLTTVETMLRDAGYSCATSQTGTRAIALARGYRHSLKVALLDAIMPGEDEAKLLRALREVHPSLTVIGFTGASSERGEALRLAGAARILHKPVDSKVLRDVMRSLVPRPDRAANQ